MIPIEADAGKDISITHVSWSWLTAVWAWFTPDKVIAVATFVYALVAIVIFFAICCQAKAAQQSFDLAW